MEKQQDRLFFAQGWEAEWSAPEMISPKRIREKLNSLHLVGRKIARMLFVGVCYSVDQVEDLAYAALSGLPEEEHNITCPKDKYNYATI